MASDLDYSRQKKQAVKRHQIASHFPVTRRLAASTLSKAVSGAVTAMLLAALPVPSAMAATTFYPSAVNTGSSATTVAAPTFAFYYGINPPVPELRSFDYAVVDPDSHFDPKAVKTPDTKWLAYVSLGEVEGNRSYAKDIPANWYVTTNQAWDAKVVDQTAAGWSDFVLNRLIEPLWQQGYRGFFLDTLDSYQLAAKTDAERKAQQDAMVNIITAIKQRHPDARLIFNRGFEMMPRIGRYADAVTFESLTKTWDQHRKVYGQVSAVDRKWLLDQLGAMRKRGDIAANVPLISIDYCAPGDRQCGDQAIAAAAASPVAVTPYVTDGQVQTIGRGEIEVVPRRILVLQNRNADTNIDTSAGVRFASMPLNYLGYKVEYIDSKDGELPADVYGDRYAGVVVWTTDEFGADTEKVTKWLKARKDAGVPIVIFNQLGAGTDSQLARLFNFTPVAGGPTGKLSTIVKDPLIGFEIKPPEAAGTLIPVRAQAGSQVLVQEKSEKGNYQIDQVAITPWGGFALAPFPVVDIDDIEESRWGLQPIEFLKRALRLQTFPVPDVTTEYGRRMLLSHVDGDGFASRNEFFPGGYPATPLTTQIWDHYKLPVTLSIIEGEIGPTGMYPKLSPELEKLARAMFKLPYVEVGSHTYSHPFSWNDATAYMDHKPAADQESKIAEGFHLDVPGYKFNLDREISGTINYINKNLTTPAKPVVILQWPGSCDPPAIAVQKTYEAGALNINGGDTLITKSANSWTNIAPIGIDKGPNAFQVFAPNQNEDLYTNNWTGPFYGFRRLIETFELTDQPIRFKPMNVYYHMYSGTKLASLQALKDVFDYATAQPNYPLFASEYARKVLDFQEMGLAKRNGRWLVRTNGDLHTLRLPVGDAPELATSTDVVGYKSGPGGTYVHLEGASGSFAYTAAASAGNSGVPYIASANGRISNFTQRSGQLGFSVNSYVSPIVELGNAASCRVTVNGRSASPRNAASSMIIDARSVPGLSANRNIDIQVSCAG